MCAALGRRQNLGQGEPPQPTAMPGEGPSCELAALKPGGSWWDDGVSGLAQSRCGPLPMGDTELQEFLTLVKRNEKFISCLSIQVKSKEEKAPGQKNK